MVEMSRKRRCVRGREKEADRPERERQQVPECRGGVMRARCSQTRFDVPAYTSNPAPSLET
jgi:hypothetical protein